MFFIIPVGVNYRTDRMPVVTFSLLGLNTLIHLAAMALYYSATPGPDGERPEWFIEHLGLIPAGSPWYTWFTSQFVHANFWHLLGNMIYLFLFGSCVEDVIGRWQYAVFYLAGGLAADFLHIIASAGQFASTIPLVGASGAISACMGGFVLLHHRNQIEFQYFLILFFRFFQGEFSLPAWLVISFWFLKDAAFAVLDYTSRSGTGGTAFAAHVGGFIGGMTMIGLWKAYRRYRPAAAVAEPGAEAGDEPGHAEIASGGDGPADLYLFENGAQIGPFSRAQILGMLEMGSVSADALYWRDGMADWMNVQELRSGR